MSWDNFFPTRQGGSIGKSLEGGMLDKVGGPNTIRTEIRTLPDGSEVMLRTRGGYPEFTVKPAKPILVAPPAIMYNFQGLPISTTHPYGYVSAGVPATSSTPSTGLLWDVANISAVGSVLLSTKAFEYHGDSEWRDTRETREFDQVVSWRGCAELSRNAPMAYPFTVYPAEYSFVPFADYESYSSYYGVVWVDGVAYPKIEDDIQVLAAALHRIDITHVVVRAVATRRVTGSSVVGFGYSFPVTGIAATVNKGFRLYEIPLGGTAWTLVGFIEMEAVIWQAPVLNASGTHFSGLSRQLASPTANADIKKAQSKRFTCAFSSGAAPVISDAYTQRSWIRHVTTIESNLMFAYVVASEVIAVDYVGDNLHEATWYDWTIGREGTIYRTTDAGDVEFETILDFTSYIRAQQVAHGMPNNYYNYDWVSYVKIVNGVSNGNTLTATVIKSSNVTATQYWFRVLTRVPGIGSHAVFDRTHETKVTSSNGLQHTVRDRKVLYKTARTIYPPVTVTLGEFTPSTFIGGSFQILVNGVAPYSEGDGGYTITDEYNGRVTSIDLRARSIATAKQTLVAGEGTDVVEVLPIVNNDFFFYADGGPQSVGEPTYTPVADGNDTDGEITHNSGQPALAHQPGAPLHHATHPHLSVAVFTGPTPLGQKTVVLTPSGVTDVTPIPTDGANSMLTSPLFFRRYPQ